MIRHTFCHLSGIGPKTELQLWEMGYLAWDDLPEVGLPPRLASLPRRIEESREALVERDWNHFRRLCSGCHAWRWFDTLRDRVLYLDIETTGDPPGFDSITAIACYDSREARCFVRDVDLGEFPYYVRDFDLLVTYNGATFDVPQLRAHFPRLWLPPVHLDLRYPLRSLGYRGGLKQIEQTTGLAREDGLQGVDGWMAVLLWHRHLAGDQRALPTLTRYAIEDVLALEPLAELVYNRLSKPLPVPAPILGPTPRRQLELPYSLELLLEMQGELARARTFTAPVPFGW
ncbi:MAG: ribonuclease H-like domain-containing protein [Armatimonadetes bacterium]|nr:ribonuclease H-like domain-containing protein [Armatimonadota bacterium]